MFCCTLLNVHSSIAIIFMGKRELVALLNLSSWCLMMVEWLFLPVPWGCLRSHEMIHIKNFGSPLQNKNIEKYVVGQVLLSYSIHSLWLCHRTMNLWEMMDVFVLFEAFWCLQTAFFKRSVSKFCPTYHLLNSV